MVSIGSVTVQASWVAIASAILITSLFLYVRKEKVIADWYSNAVFLFILTWKLSVILFIQDGNFPSIDTFVFQWRHERVLHGIAAIGIYTFFKLKKTSSVIIPWILTAAMYEFISKILGESHLWLTISQLTVNMVFLVFVIRSKGQLSWRIQILTLFTFIQGFIYSISGELLSVPMVTYVVIAISSSFKRNRGVEQ